MNMKDQLVSMIKEEAFYRHIYRSYYDFRRSIYKEKQAKIGSVKSITNQRFIEKIVKNKED